jgi:hypothetical protein
LPLHKMNMSFAIKIEVTTPVTTELIHRFRNFGEEVYRSLKETCSVSIEEIDASTNTFVVQGIRRRDLGRVTLAIKDAVKRHGFEDSASLVRLN